MPQPHRSDTLAPVGTQLLAEHLRSDVAAREASVTWFNSGVASFFLLCAVGLSPQLGWPRALTIISSCAVYALYYGWISWVLRRGWFHPAICWFNLCLETGAGVWLFAYDIIFADAEQALSNPAAVLWSTLIVLAALRSKRHALFAGCLVAAEMLLLYFFVALPRLPPPVPVMFSPPLMVQRAVYYFITGGMAAMVAGHIARKAEEALHAIRAKELLGKYFLHERLGVGGMAEVFRATYSPEGGFEKVVAIKRILPAYAGDEDFVTLFRREAELGSLLNHPNIIQVLDVGRFADTYFMAMEHIEGVSLRELLKSHGPLPPEVVAYIGAELGEALDYVHRRTSSNGVLLRLVHRDVNPPNILLSRIGEVKLGDFGVARAAIHVRLTQADRVRGKLGYMAPEQARGESFDGRADLFALGATLHEALTGKPLFKGEDISERLKPTAPLSLLPPSAFRPDVPPELDAAIMDLLQWRTDARTPRGKRLREQLCGLTGAHAPYPHGQQALARLIHEALVHKAHSEAPRNEEPATEGPTQAMGEEEPTAVVELTDKRLVTTGSAAGGGRGQQG
ncbi:serine/threonine-protein kinase [Archangium lansingense]|uniref:Serine/threonine-protein kinase n=1 Tax=Archangium lansingense TaxID=2995310 RepID=A0ABT4A8W3_9BACT|nr:serine/threonine-protein kinase [Archangium lansinium]MCY1077377.1 serine/threonine-protein kinase [Archangium lansinium]